MICFAIMISTYFCSKRLSHQRLLSIYITSGFTIALLIFPPTINQLFFKILDPVFRIPAFIVLTIYFLLFVEIELLTAIAVFSTKQLLSTPRVREILIEMQNNTVYIFLTALVYFVMPVNTESITFYFNDFLFAIILIELAKSVFNRIVPLFIQLMS